jgi:RING finger/CHY zinc finger protein 1
MSQTERIKMNSCEHYIRNCKFVSPCCGKIYTCRFCHNENESHEINRFEVKEIVCSKCNHQQEVSNQCTNCGIEFAKYFCKTCNFFDDRAEKGYYHCDKCGICRVGENRKFVHCDICNSCVIDDKGHICRKDAFRTPCPVCLEDLFISTRGSYILACGHPIHIDCLNECIKNNKRNCSLCRKSIYSAEDLQKINQYIDAQIMLFPFSEEISYNIKCNDCSFNGEAKFHPYGMKCGGCGGYNTTRT